MKLPSMCVSHSGADPVWHGGPTQRRIQAIKSLTRSREDTGRQFYVTHDGWHPLRNAVDFEILNGLLNSVAWMDKFPVRVGRQVAT